MREPGINFNALLLKKVINHIVLSNPPPPLAFLALLAVNCSSLNH
jgi:hypothetical protein